MMSNDEQRAQHETINTIARQIATIKMWWPIAAISFSLILSIGTLAIGGYKYDANLVKQSEYKELVRAVIAISAEVKHNRAKDSTDNLTVVESVKVVSEKLDKIAEHKPVVVSGGGGYSVTARRVGKKIVYDRYYN